MKTRFPQTKIFIWKFIPNTYSIIYLCQKPKLRVLKLLMVSIDRVLFRFNSDKVLYSFLSYMALLRILSEKLFFRVPINRFLSCVISALFAACNYFCIKKCDYVFIKKIFSYLRNFNKSNSKKMKKYLHGRDKIY